MSTLESMGLVIHQSEETHKSGYILDLILTELGSTIKVLDYRCGPYLSDHSTTECTMSIIHDNITRQQISYQKTKNINIKQFIADCDLTNLNKDDLNSMVEDFNSRLLSALDANAPMVSKEVTVRHSPPWFNEGIHKPEKDCKMNVKRSGRNIIYHQTQQHWKWKDPSTETCWKQPKRCHHRHGYDCGRNSKKLYTLVTNLTGTFKENPLPEGLSNKELAEQFAKFFITKIKKIRHELDDKEIYSPR